MNKIHGDLFVNPLETCFSRRGSFLAFANSMNGEDLIGKCTLWLCNCRINLGTMSFDMNMSNGFRQIKLELVKDGIVLPALISTTPYEIILSSNHGSVRFTIGERKLVMCRGENGLSLRITTKPRFMQAGSMNTLDELGTKIVSFGMTRLLAIPFTGTFTETLTGFDINPDENGVIQLGFEDFLLDPVMRPVAEYPSYDECVNAVKADFDSFCESVCPTLPAPFEPMRLRAVWNTWNMIVDPDGEAAYTHTMVKMIHSIFEGAFVWQQPMQAIWLSSNLSLAWDVFVSSFAHMDANGRMTDSLNFRENIGGDGLKPPIHGMSLLWLMDNTDFASVPKESKEFVWDGMIRWTEYFFKFRDRDHDGLAEFQSALETGWEDASYYKTINFPNASPDLNAFLALSMEAVARLGRDIGKPEDVCDKWDAMSKELIGKIVKNFWDGERWYAFNPLTGKKSDFTTPSVALYVPLVLGRRLPQDIIDKSIEFVFSADGFNTPFGLASEGLRSDYFTHGFTSGSIIVPTEHIMVLALEECGRADLAKQVAKNYCAILRDNGLYHIHNALTGKGDRSLTAFGEPGLYWSAWASSCSFWMASRYGD